MLPASKRFLCVVCDKSFTSSRALQMHNVKVHRTNTSDLVPECSQETKTTATNEFQCVLCQKQFNSAISVKQHMVKVHPNAKTVTSMQEKRTDDPVASETSSVSSVSSRTRSRYVVPQVEDVSAMSSETDVEAECTSHKTAVGDIRGSSSHVSATSTSALDPECSLKTMTTAQKNTECTVCQKQFKSVGGLKLHTAKLHSTVKTITSAQQTIADDSVARDVSSVSTRTRTQSVVRQVDASITKVATRTRSQSVCELLVIFLTCYFINI